MANYKVVDAEQLDNDLRSIADTIRAKNGTTEDINFPEGYIAAYESTPTIIENVEANLNFANGDQMESLPEGYAAKSVKIKKPENLTPENIAEGVEIAGIVGTHEGGCDHNIIEHIEIALDFSNGDMTERLPEGYSANSVTIFKPETLIPENIAKDVNIAGIVGTHEGGGSVEGTATVTFCNYDGSVLYTRLVFIGDDCASPVTQGKLDTPTRASDVQYNYTFSGWSATQGGSASSTVLNNITADKTVYAAYTTSLVYYTVRFYDGDTLMQESQVGYGQTATPPSTTKSGYTFIGWTVNGEQKEDLTIITDTDFVGVWTANLGYSFSAVRPANISASNTSYVTGCYSPDGSLFAYYQSGNNIYIMKTSDGSLVKTLETGGGIKRMLFSPNSQYFAYTSQQAGSSTYVAISCYKCDNWSSHVYKSHSGTYDTFEGVTFSPDNSYLYATRKNNKSVYYWDLNTKEYFSKSIRSMPSYTYCAKYVNNRLILLGSGGAVCIKMSGATFGEVITLPNMFTSGVVSGAINNDGTKVFALNSKGENKLYTIDNDFTISEETLPIAFDTNYMAFQFSWWQAEFSPDSAVLAVPNNSKGFKLIDITKSPVALYYEPDISPKDAIQMCTYSNTGHKFAACGSAYNDTYSGAYLYDTVSTV